MQGKLIVIDGGDGSGKQTQTAMLVKRLRARGYPTETIDFPQYQNNFYGKIIRAYLDGQFGDPKQIAPLLASCLYCLDRFETKAILKQWLEEGKIVVCDRFHTANFIHQGAKLAPEQRMKLVETLEAFEFELLDVPRPNWVIYLHVLPKLAREMMLAQGRILDGHENDLGYAKEVEKTALWACEKFGWKKIECCDGGKILSREAIHQLIWESVQGAVDQ